MTGTESDPREPILQYNITFDNLVSIDFDDGTANLLGTPYVMASLRSETWDLRISNKRHMANIIHQVLLNYRTARICCGSVHVASITCDPDFKDINKLVDEVRSILCDYERNRDSEWTAKIIQ